MSTIFIGRKELPEDPNTLIIDSETASISIEEIRPLLNFVSRGSQKTVLIKRAELLTEEAQNALLKILEEPPNGADIILETTDEDLLLETIRSRCELVYTKSQPLVGNTDLFTEITKATISERLTLAKTYGGKRPEALDLIDSLLVASKVTKNAKTIRSLFKAKNYLKANCTVRLVIENLFLNW